MDNHTLLPLIFLYTNDREGVEGSTKFQKLVFLAQEEGEMPEAYDDYRPDRFGPFSHKLQSDLLTFMQEGYIERHTEPVPGGFRYVYSLTPDGMRVAQNLIDDYRQFFDVADRIKREFNNKSGQEILRYVYAKYESYTTATELDTDRLLDPDVKTPMAPKANEGGGRPTIAEQLEATPHTLYQLPKRDTNAYFYYFTDDFYTTSDSKFKTLDDALTLMGRNRGRLKMVMIDRDRCPPETWELTTEAFDIDEYPALVVAETELGVGDVEPSDPVFRPGDADYAVIESGIFMDDVISDHDEVRQFLTGLFDAAIDDDIEASMKKDKVLRGLTITAEKLSKIVTLSA